MTSDDYQIIGWVHYFDGRWGALHADGFITDLTELLAENQHNGVHHDQ